MSYEQGCRCAECFGFAEYMLELTGQDYGLPRAPGCKPKAPKDTCTDTYDCGCKRCEAQRAVLTVPRKVRQPWEPRPARAA